MEVSSDLEEIIPPTPVQQKFCSRTDKTLKPKSNVSKKSIKTNNCNFKRKRIISPDFKKVKQKVKQVTLYNFLINVNKTADPSVSPCSSKSPVRINLLHKFENTEVKNDDCASTVPSVIPIVESSCSETNSALLTNEGENEICNEVALLQLNSKSVENVLTDKDSVSSHISNVEDAENIDGEKKFIDVDESYTWMTDFDWENDKENLKDNCNSMQNIVSNDWSTHSEGINGSYIKFKVKNVQKDSLKNEIKLVVAACDNSAVLKTCCLRGFWTDSIIDIGDTVHILKPSTNDGAIIDNDSGFLVTNPDFLISSTAVVSTLFCMRKAALNHILPQWSPGNNIMMIGSLIHDIFQKSVNSHASTTDEILKIVKLVMTRRENLIALCCQDMSESDIEEKICAYIPNILDWIKKHCSFKGKNSFENISITKVEDVEENVWCPKYGVKGKIDMTVTAYCPNQAASKLMPLELKTGRPTFSAEHMGQVNLYSLMMEERSKEISDGLLLYLRDKAEMKVIAAKHHSKRGLIQLRNELASYIYKWVSSKSTNYEEIEQCHLPLPINNKRLCEKCPYLLPCTVYQNFKITFIEADDVRYESRAFSKEKVLETTHAMHALVPTSTKHLTASHLAYFLHWSRLLLLESTTTAEVKAFWTEDAVSREKRGMSLSYVLLDKNTAAKQEVAGGYFTHTFIRSADCPISPDFSNSCLKEGDYVAISNQNNLDGVAVAMGYIVAVSELYIELAIERDLGALDHLKDLVFRIDKQVSNSAAACVRNNLMLLMQEENQAAKLRKFIIDKETPSFLKALPKQIVLLGRPILKCLNKNQQKAVLKAIMAEDYFLIKGMPGTGKTSTIAALVRLLVKMKVSVLLASYTHSAIDNVLLKLKEHLDFVRIGPKYRIHPGVLEYSFEHLTKDFSSVDQFSTFMKEKMVVATTCLGINHAIFKLRKFDICIVDEASQINQIACLGPLFFAKKFILVGDDKQLPPLVLNSVARKKGMQESLFQKLQNPLNCIELSMQYRMNREIMRLCNELTYNGALQCGSDAVANAVLHLNGELDIAEKDSPSWLLTAVSTDIAKSVMFLNTDKYETDEIGKSKNDTEAVLVIFILQFLLQNNIAKSDVGIIAPYRKQVDLIEAKLKSLKLSEIEVNTVDQYQGRDKDVIIISCVRPHESLPKSEKTGVILDDEKRLNVAISRAKTKLILIGSKAVLSTYKPFKDLINCLRSDQFLDVT